MLHHITFSGSITRKAHFKKKTNVTKQEMYMSYKQLQHTSIITNSDSTYTFLITCYQINVHCLVQTVTKAVTYMYTQEIYYKACWFKHSLFPQKMD